MRIQVSKKLPPIEELVKILRQEFSGRYSYRLFGLGKRSILVGQSTLIGAEICIGEQEVSITSSPPSIFAGILHVLALTELAVLFIPVVMREGLPSKSKGVALEKEIGLFLVQKYGYAKSMS
ncbi:MAG: hypothetical protein AAF551_09920 [Bacteroidota bacterium]